MDKKLPKIVEYLGDKKFLTGADPTWIDFYFVEIVELMSKVFDTELFSKHPTLKTYVESVFALPGVKEYLASADCKETTYKFNNKVAKINN